MLILFCIVEFVVAHNRYGERHFTHVDKAAEFNMLSQHNVFDLNLNSDVYYNYLTPFMNVFMEWIRIISGFTDIYKGRFYDTYLSVVEIIQKINQTEIRHHL